MYGDESDVHLNPIIGPVWHKCGERWKVAAALQNRKVYVFGVLNVKSGRVHYRIFKRKRAVEFLEFLRWLLKRYRRWKVYLVLDNFVIHKTKKVQKFCRENQRRLKIVWLPTYSPRLNLIERFWTYMKAHTVRNHFFGDVVKLAQALHSFFRKYHNGKIERIVFEEKHLLRKAA
jgi:putative transposase